VAIRLITIARQEAVDGEALALKCAQRFGFRLFDREVLERAAAVEDAPVQELGEAEHKPSFMARLLDAMAMEAALPASYWQDWPALGASRSAQFEKYREDIEEVIRRLYDQGQCVILGHAAQVVLRDRPDVLRVLVTGSLSFRVRRLRQQSGMDDEQATDQLNKMDSEKQSTYQNLYHVDWLNPGLYDLTINTDHLRADQAAELVGRAVELLSQPPIPG
jgi:cytidylate kinase